MRRAFTLIEILVVIGIIAVLAAILFPVFSRAKEAAKKVSCLEQVRQIGQAFSLYLADSEDVYPESKRPSSNPEIDDNAGQLEEPDFDPPLVTILPYTGTGSRPGSKLFACPSDPDPFGQQCYADNPDAPPVTSYLINAFFVFGLNFSAIDGPSDTILISERRSEPSGATRAYCDYMYRPWFSNENPQAPENEMDSTAGAVATRRHADRSDFAFSDTHVKTLAWAQTYAPPQIDLHRITP